MRFLPAAVLVDMCGLKPPKIEQNGKTVAPDISQTEHKVCKNSRVFGLLAKIFYLTDIFVEERAINYSRILLIRRPTESGRNLCLTAISKGNP